MRILALFLLLSSSVGGAEAQQQTLVLDTMGFRRCYYVLRPPVVKHADGKLSQAPTGAKWLDRPTSLPPANWRAVDFDDGTWHRAAGVFQRRQRRGVGPNSPMIALACSRETFAVTDVRKARDLKLTITYHGGAVVYLNGVEVARGHLPAGKITSETLAEDYPLEAQIKADGSPLVRTQYRAPKEVTRRLALQERTLKAALPTRLLREGTNVLAVELHRAPYHPKAVTRSGRGGRFTTIGWGSCGLTSLRATAQSPEGVVPNVSRPTGVQVWNSSVLSSDFDQDWGDPNASLRPLRIVGTRGGAFSAKVVVGSDKPIKGLRATASDLVHAQRRGTIPASAVEVRYALPWGYEHGSGKRYPLPVGRFDTLSPTPPEEVEVRVKQPRSRRQKIEDMVPRPVFGAICPVWATVHVPPGAAPGDYAGTLTVSTSTGVIARVPVKLAVSAWTLPEPKDYRTFVEFIQSPDTLALAFNTPLWSEKHWQLIEESLRLLGQTGNKTCYVPLICETNLGNAESMVRWRKKAGGGYSYDFTVFDRTLDLVQKHQGKPEMVTLVVWDVFLEGGRYTGRERYIPKDVKADRAAHADEGPQVTLLGPAGKTTKLTLPKQSQTESRALWKPLLDAVMTRLERRGLAEVAAFGFTTDTRPPRPVVMLYKDLQPTVPWMRQAHSPQKDLYGVPLRYQAYVWSAYFARDPETSRDYGWQQSALRVQFPRSGMDAMPMVTQRLMGELNVAGQQRGFGRLGGDTWHVMKDARGRRVGRVTEGRFPRSSWRALNIVSAYLAPANGRPAATARLEMVREGVQECEARIFIERALLDKKTRTKLGEQLATRAQRILDARTVDMLRGVNAFSFHPHFTSNAADRHMWWHCPAVLGAHWFIGSGWQQRSAMLFDAAAEVDRVLHEDR